MTLPDMEAYADRQLQRYDRRLLKVRAWQRDNAMRLLERPRMTHDAHERFEQLASRIIRKRDAFMVRMIGTLDPVHYT